eukprot:1475313-Alexandrium_andersonii.AAC.1
MFWERPTLKLPWAGKLLAEGDARAPGGTCCELRARGAVLGQAIGLKGQDSSRGGTIQVEGRRNCIIPANVDSK